MSKIVYIYSDKGVSRFSLNCVVKQLKKMSVQIKPIHANELIETFWENTALALIMPGGRDLSYMEKLKGYGNLKIRSYVENGGSYLGICAGAYYGSGYVEFEKNNPLEVLGERELKFTKSKAVGPAYKEPKFKYNSHNGARASLISYKSENTQKTCYMYFNGGCFFEKASKSEIIGKYNDLGSAAILKKKIKNGKAVLSGVHFECFYDDFKNSFVDLFLLEKLKSTDKQRNEIFEDIINYLAED